MSEEEQGTSSQDPQMVAEFKEGQLEIVELSTYDKDQGSQILAEASEGSSDDYKYMQVVDSSGKNVVLDLLNMTLLKCDNGGQSYRLVSSSSECGDGETATCILLNDDGEDEQQYMMVDGESGPLVYLDTELREDSETDGKFEAKKQQQPNPEWIIERAKALQASKAIMSTLKRGEKKGRKRKGDLPPPYELLTSPKFKLYLYSCKLCPFKCNAIKELSAHKAAEHSGEGRWRTGGRSTSIALQCPRCPFRGNNDMQLSKHISEAHLKTEKEDSDYVVFGNKVYLNSAEVEAADVLVCGACGFESSSKADFKKHIEDEHGATAC